MRRWLLFGALMTLAFGVASCAAGEGVDTADAQTPVTTEPSPTTTPPATTTSTTSVVPGEITSLTPNVGDLDAIVLPDTEGRLPPDTQVNCRGGMQPFPISALDDVPLLSDAGMPQIEEAIRPFLESEEGKYWPQSGWQVLYPTDTAVLIAHTDPASPEPNLALMSVEYHDGAWMWSGSSSGGECVLAVQPPPGLNIVDWRLDPATPPTPESTSIAVLLTERACASGEPVGDRLRGPQVVVTDTEVLVTFAAEPQGGSHTCPGNPPTPTTIELSGPLGSRGIRDGLDLGMALDDAIGR